MSLDTSFQASVEALLRADRRAMEQLTLVRDHGPQNAFVAAGFVRNRVWDALYCSAPELNEADVDVVYFCSKNPDKKRDFAYEDALGAVEPSTDWQVRNQAHMHAFGGHPPFKSLEHGLMHWAETATSVGVRLDDAGQMHFVAPFGTNDLRDHILRVTPVMRQHDLAGFERRLSMKGWQERWPDLTVIR